MAWLLFMEEDAEMRSEDKEGRWLAMSLLTR
jgi:hypothetical protein